MDGCEEYSADAVLTVEDMDIKVTFNNLLMFATGTEQIPALGFDPEPTLEFLHIPVNGSLRIYPEDNICGLVLRLPLHASYEALMKHMYHLEKMRCLNRGGFNVQFSHSITGGDWWAYQDPDKDVIKYLATIAVAAAGMSENSNLWIMENSTEWTTVRTVKRVAGRVATVKEMPMNMTCYQNDGGQESMGHIPASHCDELYMTASTTKETGHMCLGCLWNTTISIGRLPQYVLGRCYLSDANSLDQARCKQACSTVHVPDNDGTSVVEEWYWLCGHVVYTSLPRHWTGTCAMVQLYGGTVAIKVPEQLHNKEPGNRMTRVKREIGMKVTSLQDRVKQSNLGRSNPVPKEH
ncbi:G2 M phase-specific E3 ubiquitin- ligase-like protein [Labeo rohita]|uniref:G2 M phase-specific E3 ubiquitin-ligase-like protein n=1 Tax=Labeo rohita TaxID=84645 RepID=A0A498MYI3_LABRO|nr:G2 M phase-specific E3 ubiquitin- ligase-like protein [Labeo rohita]